MERNYEAEILELAAESAGVNIRDLGALKIPRHYLYKLHRQGVVERVARGLYARPDAEPSAHQTLVEAAKRVPEGVACLLTALHFHGLTTQMPHQVWLAIPPGKRRPKEPRFPIRLFHFSEASYEAGLEEHEVAGRRVKIYSPAKTVADCFKFRNKIGLDVALEALRDCRKQGSCLTDDLYRFAKICRVWNVMRPYLEAIS